MTPTQLKTAVLSELQVISPDMPVSSDDMAKVTEKYAGLHAALLTEGLATWGLAENIPTNVEQPMVTMLAAYSAKVFGVPNDRYAQLLIEGGFQMPQMSLAERQLRKALNGRYLHSELQTDYF